MSGQIGNLFVHRLEVFQKRFHLRENFATAADIEKRGSLSLTAIDRLEYRKRRQARQVPRFSCTPEAIPFSVRILNAPIAPVAATWVPPQSSFAEVGHRHNPHIFLIFFAKKSHCPFLQRLLSLQDSGDHRHILPNSFIDRKFDFFNFGLEIMEKNG